MFCRLSLSILIILLSLSKGYTNALENPDYIKNIEALIVKMQYEKALHYIDSLLSINQIFENQKIKNQLTNKKADAYYYLNNNQQAFEYYLRAANQEDLRPENNKKFISEAFGNAAYCLTEMGLYEKSIKYSKLSYKYAYDSSQLAIAANSLGVNYKYMGNYALAFEYFDEAYTIDKNLNDSIGIAYDLNNLAYVFKEWKKYKRSLAYFKESLAIMKKANRKKAMATRFNNISQVYLEMNNLPEAERNVSKALAIDREIRDSLKMAIHINLLGAILELKGNYKDAIIHHLNALKMHQKFQSRHSISATYRLLSQSYFKLNQPKEAIKWLDQGIEIARSNRFVNELMMQFKLKAKFLNSIGSKTEARYYEDNYRLLKDSVYSITNSNKLQKLELAHELSKKEAEIEKINLMSVNAINKVEANSKKNTLFLVVGFFILSLISFIFIRIRHNKKSIVYQADIEVLQNRINALLQNNPESLDIKINDINTQLESPLSEREFQILKFIFTKKSNTEIGFELDLSVNTIKFHFKNIFKKFGVRNRKEALQFLLA